MSTENAGVPKPGRVMSLPVDTSRAVPVFTPRRPPRRPAPAEQRRPPYAGRAVVLLAGADVLAATAAAVPLGEPVRAAVALGPALAVVLLFNARRGLHRPGPATTALDELPRLLPHCVIAWCVATAVLVCVRPSAAPGWALLAAVVTVHLTCAGLLRGAVHLLRRRNRRRHPHSALVVGGGAAGRRVTAALHDHPEYGIHPVGLVLPAPAPEPADDPSPPAELPVPVLVSPEDITRAVIQNAVRDAVFTRGPWEDPRDAALARLLAEQGCTVWLVHAEPAADTGPRRPGGPDHLWGFACRRLDAPPRNHLGILGKRALDVLVAAVALICAAPVLLACAVAVRWSDGPGVIFRQERVGMAGRPFTVLKFRTLRPADEHESATLWNVADDRRMSAVGRLLRRTSLDELPQLWNVLRGDMSLVGPRPERPFFVRQFSKAHPGYAARHRMPVGITGLAQVHGLRGDTSIEDRARFDNHYIETWSLWQDVRILLRTAGSLFRHGGS
ncbi:sugar transferase [Streptomyces sp. bgisy100]|uniref:sugar transferase n=1 Tax=Streptomyces sp. bgisy100 TaxID=3413783 RepID=UPI003D727987